MVAAFRATRGLADRSLIRWMARATSSLPTPLWPTMSTWWGRRAMKPICSRTIQAIGDSPTMPL